MSPFKSYGTTESPRSTSPASSHTSSTGASRSQDFGYDPEVDGYRDDEGDGPEPVALYLESQPRSTLGRIFDAIMYLPFLLIGALFAFRAKMKELLKPKRTTDAKMPWARLSSLMAMRFAEPIALTSIIPYAPVFVLFLGAEKADVGEWVGTYVSSLLLAEMVTMYFWTVMSNRYGRKKILLTGLLFTALSHMLWGYSSNLGQGLAARVIGGLFNGNKPIYQTVVNEMVEDTDLLPQAQVLNPAIFFIGSMFGPMIGGWLFNPLKRLVGMPSSGSVWSTYPALFVSIVIAILTATSALAGWMFLPESHPKYVNAPDLGIEVGKQFGYRVSSVVYSARTLFGRNRQLKAPEKPEWGMTSSDDSVSITSSERFFSSWSVAGFVDGVREVFTVQYWAHVFSTQNSVLVYLRRVLSSQNVLNIVVRFFMAMHTLAGQELLPIFLQQEQQDPASMGGFFRFRGGLGLTPSWTSGMIAISAFSTLFVQLFVYPWMAARVNNLTLLRVVLCIYPFVYMVFPFTVHIVGESNQRAAVIGTWVFLTSLGTAIFPCSNILIRFAATKDVMADVNALVAQTASFGRMFGPAICGYVFSVGIKWDFMVLPFALLSVLALITALLSFTLREFNAEKEAELQRERDALEGNVDAIEPEATESDSLLGRR